MKGVLEGLGLTQSFTMKEGDFRELAGSIDRERLPFDFVWFDVGDGPDYADFFNGFWSLVRPSGGVLLMHYMLTNAGPGAVLADLKRHQAAHPGEMEILDRLEPHKCGQNSVTMIRWTGEYRDVLQKDEIGWLEADALALFG